MTLQPNRGVVVRDFTPQEVENVYYLRGVLERAAVPLIVDIAADIGADREALITGSGAENGAETTATTGEAPGSQRSGQKEISGRTPAKAP